jgi:phosphoribosyl-ATP pyrophosphohydrolase/phosphoribosyl-AMP cyclohydrolase
MMVKFDERGLVPAVLQDAETGQVLMLAYMNEEALRLTQQTGDAWFWSRSRQELWHKGATSSNYQHVVDLALDCDADAILVRVNPAGPACHTGAVSCFFETVPDPMVASQTEAPHTELIPSPLAAEGEGGGASPAMPATAQILDDLAALLAQRHAEMPEGSYTAKLFREGIDRIAKKVGEESAETIIAAKNASHDEIVWEVADLMFHTLVLLEASGVPASAVWQELARRRH